MRRCDIWDPTDPTIRSICGRYILLTGCCVQHLAICLLDPSLSLSSVFPARFVSLVCWGLEICSFEWVVRWSFGQPILQGVGATWGYGQLFSRKLASASWSPSCFSKVLAGMESPIAWNFILIQLTLPCPPWLVHKHFGRGSNPPGDTVGILPPAAKPAASASSASLASSAAHASSHWCSLAHYWHVHEPKNVASFSFWTFNCSFQS